MAPAQEKTPFGDDSELLECKDSDKNGGKELDRFCDTRFGTCCIVCESAKESKSALRKTVEPEAFDEFEHWHTVQEEGFKKPKTDRPSYFSFTKGQGLSRHALGTLTKKRVLSIKFWEDTDELLPVNAEPYKALRLTGQSNVRRDLSNS